MNLHENSDFGRKVFFVCPSYEFSQRVIPQLYEKEYEIYKIDDYRRAKEILACFPDSICFINVDAELKPDSWFNFIASFESDPYLSTIFLGIISARLTKSEKERFMMGLTIPAGMVEQQKSREDTIETLIGILELNGAKGRRKFIRTSCESDNLVYATFEIQGQLIQMKINDISSAGISCITDTKYSEHFTVNTLVRNFTISLHKSSLQCTGVILKTSVVGGKLRFVLVFTQHLSFSIRHAIREYVHNREQDHIDSLMAKTLPDEADYSKPVTGAAAFVIPGEAEELAPAEDLPAPELGI